MPVSLPLSDPTTDYARAVVAGTVPAGKWHRLCCRRHLTDLEANQSLDSQWQFRTDLAEKGLVIFGLFRHYKGEWAGTPIQLQPWQQFIVGSLMGWVSRETGLRRFRNAFVELPRGNGKSTLAGGLLVLFGFFLNEGGAEAYSVATKKDQARISFQAGRQMLLRSPALRQHVTTPIGKHNVHNADTESKMEPLGADADTLDGLRPFLVVADEIHKLKSQDIIDVMESGMGTRLEPLLFEITTAGQNDQSVYGQHYTLSTRVLDGTVPLDEWFAFIASAELDEDWTLEATWRKANPNYGISIKPDFLAKECKKALANPAEQAKFRLLYLGQKVQDASGYFSSHDWRACPTLPAAEELRQRPCYMGFDLASTTDITAAVLVWVFEGDEFALRPYFWMPEDTLEDRGRQDRMPYGRWRDEGYLRVTPGKSIDRQVVRRDLVEIAKAWQPKEFCADPWQMQHLGPELIQDGVPVVLVPQTPAKLSVPTKTAQAKILDRHIRHDHNPLMAVMVANASARYDDRGNVTLSKRKSIGRIDGCQALVNAIAQIPVVTQDNYQMFVLGAR